MAPLYEAEADRWSRLDWDTTAQWLEVERGRQFGTLSGLVVLDDAGAALGWTYFQIRSLALQIGLLESSSDAVTEAIVAKVLSDQTLAFVESVTLFALTDAPGLTPALRHRGLSVDRYWYMGRELQRVSPPSLTDIRRWRFEDVQPTADLLARAYKDKSEARPFAPAGQPQEWTEYVDRLTRGFGCGALLPEASLCIPSGPNRIAGVALVTTIGESTAHLAQLAVDPQFQGRRLGLQLMELASAAAARSGYRRMTLLVGGSNRRARSLYEASRFQVMGSFVAAGSLQPRRSTSVAPGGAFITRR